jgi:tetratricopeptide (TPR) repeat protein
MMKPGSRSAVIAAMVCLFLLLIPLGNMVSHSHDDYEQTPDTDTPLQALAPALLGFREVAASLLWVKTDDYFHRGEYQPILNLVRLITTIDPHQIDVYTTGAWHMAYNFMDKRLIRTGLEFLEGGVKNNPTIYDLYFELGYTNVDKTRDFEKAIYWYKEASTKGTTDGKKLPPVFTWSQLAHAYEKAGNIDAAIQQWDKNVRRAIDELEEKGGLPSGAVERLEAALQRLHAIGNQKTPVSEETWVKTEQELRTAAATLLSKDTDFARRTNLDVAWHNGLYLTYWRRAHRRHLSDDPLPAGLNFTVKKTAPRKLLIEGTINVLDLSRVNVTFRDRKWQQLELLGDDERMQKQTLEWDNPSVKGSHFKWELNLNRDPADMERDPKSIYPLASDEYELVVTYNPRVQAPFIQDVYGWNGEGITDPQLLVIDDTKAGFVEGKRVPLRLIQKTIILKRSDVL